MLSKNHPAVIFIDRNGFSVCQDALANIPRFNFTPDLVSNLDVVNREQFMNLIVLFIQINKMVPSSFAVILSDDIIYIKDLVNSAPKPASVSSLKTEPDDINHEDEVQNFLEDIPFEEILARIIKSGNMNRIVAVNKDLVMTIIDAFTGKGFTIEAITPGFMYGQSANFTAGLTGNNVRTILENAETLRLGNLLTDQEKMIPAQNLESELKNQPNVTKKPQSLRQYILIGVFVTLLVILAVVYLNMGVSATPPPKKTKSSPVNSVITSAPIPTLTQQSITTVPVDIKQINVRILYGAVSEVTLSNLKTGLSAAGFNNILDEISGENNPERSSVVFSQNITTEIRNTTVEEIKKIFPDVSILESPDTESLITIFIGKS